MTAFLAKINWRKVAIKVALAAGAGAMGAVSSLLTKNPELLGPITALAAYAAHEAGVLLQKREASA